MIDRDAYLNVPVHQHWYCEGAMKHLSDAERLAAGQRHLPMAMALMTGSVLYVDRHHDLWLVPEYGMGYVEETMSRSPHIWIEADNPGGWTPLQPFTWPKG